MIDATPHHPAGELDERIVRYLEGRADAADVAALDAALQADPAARRRFVTLNTHARCLAELLTAEATVENAQPAARNAQRSDPLRPDPSPPHRWPTPTLRPPKRLVFTLAAALLIAAVVVAIYVFAFSTLPRASEAQPDTRNPKPASPVATVTETAGGGTLIANEDAVAPGQTIHSGPVSLDQGLADFQLTNGVAVALRGRTQLTVHDPMHATLTVGSASFDCPPAAKGFTVHLPDRSRIVDLGTAFDIELDESGVSVVRVTEGRVRIETADREPVEAAAGQAWSIVAGVATLLDLSLVNADFEDALLADATDYQPLVPGWVGIGRVGTIGDQRGSVPDSPDGAAWAHLGEWGAQIGQPLGAGLEMLDRPIEVTYLVSRRTNEGRNVDHRVMIVASSDTAYAEGVVLASADYSTELPAYPHNDEVGSVAQCRWTLTPTGDPGTYTRLWLVIENRITRTPSNAGQHQLHIDRVHVTSPPQAPKSQRDATGSDVPNRTHLSPF